MRELTVYLNGERVGRLAVDERRIDVRDSGDANEVSVVMTYPGDVSASYESVKARLRRS